MNEVKEKNNKILIIVLTIILLTMIGLTAYKFLVYDKKNDNNSVNDNTNTEEITKVSNKLIERFEYLYYDVISESDITYLDNYNANNIPNDILFDIVYKYLKVEEYDKWLKVGFTKNDIENAITKLLGNTFDKSKIVYKEYLGNSLCSLNWNEEKNIYENANGCGGQVNSNVKYKIQNTRLSNNILEIDVKMLNSKNEINEDTGEPIKTIYYSDGNRNNIIGTNENLEVEANIDDLLNKSELYRFTFKKDNDNYYFESMKKMGN